MSQINFNLLLLIGATKQMLNFGIDQDSIISEHPTISVGLQASQRYVHCYNV